MTNSVLDLIMEECVNLQGKSAAYITNYLKSLGGSTNPTMANGLLNILAATERYRLDRVAKARLDGIVIGVTGAAIVGVGIHLLLKCLEKEQSRKKIQEVVEILKQEAALGSEEKLPANNDIILDD